jgi:hypothetical protein
MRQLQWLELQLEITSLKVRKLKLGREHCFMGLIERLLMELNLVRRNKQQQPMMVMMGMFPLMKVVMNLPMKLERRLVRPKLKERKQLKELKLL